MLLADLGAEVIAIGGGRTGLPVPALSRGKRFIALDLKSDAGQAALHHLVAQSDVLMEGFRPGVAARLGAGYEDMSAINPRLIYCSVTGYGQTGTLSQRAGHDINYAAMAGALGTFGPAEQPPVPPLNLLADFAGGGMLAALGIMAALTERETSGHGQYIDAAMTDGVLSMMGMNFADWHQPTLPERGKGALTGAMPAYRCYVCSDGRWVAVGALENVFFANLWAALDLGDTPDHWDPKTWPEIEKKLGAAFAKRPMQHWANHFANIDACVTPVLEPHELANDPHLKERHPELGLHRVPATPMLSRTPPRAGNVDTTDATYDVLLACGLDSQTANAATEGDNTTVTGLSWPPLPPDARPGPREKDVD